MTNSQLEHLLDVLAPLGPRARAMFGGHGIYAGDTFFAIFYEGRLYFRVDDETREDYESAGMEPFRPPRNPRMRSYYEVPEDVAASADELVDWAATSVAAAQRVRGA